MPKSLTNKPILIFKYIVRQVVAKVPEIPEKRFYRDS